MSAVARFWEPRVGWLPDDLPPPRWRQAGRVTFYATIDSASIRPYMPDVPYLLPATSFYREGRGFLHPKLPPHLSNIAVDCGGFVAARRWGGYPFFVQEYVGWLQGIRPRWAATWDFCCEPELPGLQSRRESVRDRQERTLELAQHFIEEWGWVPWAWVPTVQGWTPDDYERAAEELAPTVSFLQSFYYERPGYDLETWGGEPIEDLDDDEIAEHERNLGEFRVGIGSLCRRASPAMIGEVVERVSSVLRGTALHLWGVKLSYLQRGALPESVASVDSAAWNGRFGRDLERVRADARRLDLSQREYSYLVALPSYLNRVQRALGDGKEHA